MKRLVVLALCSIFVFGCSTTATIHYRAGGSHEVEIVRGTPRHIIVDYGGLDRSIARDQISDIDHPGNVHAVVGGVLMAYGVLNIVVGASRCHENGKAFCLGVFTPAGVGLGMTAWGLAIWRRSKRAAREVVQRSADLTLAPTFLLGDQKGGGASVILRY